MSKLSTKLSTNFFTRPTVQVAKELLGMKLYTFYRGARVGGTIVEVEAYCHNDPACHSFCGPTQRNQVMFKRGGYCYVYFIYGVHYCVNVVTEKEGVGGAVLIRAIEPEDGIDIMRKRRKSTHLQALTSGPGKLTQALGIDRRMLGECFMTSPMITLVPGTPPKKSDILATPRIGISKATDKKWRFVIRESKFASKLRG